jgi:transposase
MSKNEYSLDLRERVVEYIKQGASYKEASARFEISISALGRWYRRYKKEGSYEARKRPGAKRRIELKELEEYVQNNPDSKTKELAKRFGVSIYTISYWLNKLGFSYKKKPLPIWKQVKRKEMNI